MLLPTIKSKYYQPFSAVIALVVFVFPVSPNYALQEWGFGGGATDQSKSTNYFLHSEFNLGEGNQLQSPNFKIGPGSEFVIMADVPPAPTLTNDERWYNQLHLVINPGPNPSDATFAVAISPNAFVSTTYYVQSDNTISDVLGSEDWRTYTSWGTTTGITIIGLQPDTTYTVKTKSEQGDFTEGPWGPTASAATDPPLLSFDIDTAATDTESSPPYAINFGDLSTTGVNTASTYLWVDLDTNAEGGASVYVMGDNAGLLSAHSGNTIDSVSADLSSTTEGCGAQVISVTETSGGPLTAESPYNGSSENVGAIDTTFDPIVSSILEPLEAGRGQIALKSAIGELTPAATDYTETLTLVAAATF